MNINDPSVDNPLDQNVVKKIQNDPNMLRILRASHKYPKTEVLQHAEKILLSMGYSKKVAIQTASAFAQKYAHSCTE